MKKSTNTTPQAAELRQQLEALFSQIDNRNERDAARQLPPKPVLDSNDCFLRLWNDVNQLVSQSVDIVDRDDSRDILLPNGFFDRMADALSMQTYVLYEGWIPRDDIPDAEILASAKAIAAGNAKALDKFRKDDHRTMFVSEPTDMTNYNALLTNLQYLANIVAHYAKHCQARNAGHYFLSVASRLYKARCQSLPHLEEGAAFRIAEDFKAGFEELAIAIDYNNLEDWKSFSKKAREIVHGGKTTRKAGR